MLCFYNLVTESASRVFASVLRDEMVFVLCVVSRLCDV